MASVWTKESVIATILLEAASGNDLSYTAVENRYLGLIRAAQRLFDSWGNAVEAAGLDYSKIRKYQKWSKEKVIKRIQEHHAASQDLSWKNVCTVLDPPLAAAALHASRFNNWNEALEAAGLNPEEIMRYRKWSQQDIRDELRELALAGAPLDRDSLAVNEPTTLAAVYRVGEGLVAERNVVLNELKEEGHQLPYPDEYIEPQAEEIA